MTKNHYYVIDLPITRAEELEGLLNEAYQEGYQVVSHALTIHDQ